MKSTISWQNPSMHPTSDCVRWMREQLLDEVADFNIILSGQWPGIRRGFRTATRDSGVPFPSKHTIANEAWGPWEDGLRNQIRNASSGQIDAYFHQRYPSGDCSVCGATWSKRSKGKRRRTRVRVRALRRHQ